MSTAHAAGGTCIAALPKHKFQFRYLGANVKISRVQTVRKAVLLAGLIAGATLVAVTSSTYPPGERTHETVEWVGIVLIVTCILGRTWASLYIGGRKINNLVQSGPYSVCRNPLYFFSVLGAAGIGAQVGSIILGLSCAAIAMLVFTVVVIQEEQLLKARHGAAFVKYKARVPRFLPNPQLWKDVPTLTVHQLRVVRTFADALIFLMSVPAAEFIEILQEGGYLPVLLHLP
jgi:protein-S-isoprenylcysteine O-methyltransferase Ste14